MRETFSGNPAGEIRRDRTDVRDLRRSCRARDITPLRASNAPALGMLGDMHLPEPRGPLSEALFRDLVAARAAPATVTTAARIAPADALTDDDLQISLGVLYELHYRGFEDVADGGSGTRPCCGCAPGSSAGTSTHCAGWPGRSTSPTSRSTGSSRR